MKRKYILILCTGLVFLTFFFGVFFKGKTLSTTTITPSVFSNGVFNYKGHIVKTLPLKDPGAFSWHHYPMMLLNSQAYMSGQLPLWDPYLGSGQPLAANQQSGGFSPLYLLLFINPGLLMWDLFMIFRLLIAFTFTFLFARRLGFNQKAAFLSSVVFTFSGYFWFFITMNHLSVEVLIPAAFYFCQRLLDEKRSINVVGLSLVYGLALLSGMPEASFLLIVISSFYFLIRLIMKSRQEGRSFLFQKGSYFALSLAIGFAISAVLILPFIEFLRNAWHTHASSSSAGIRKSLLRGLSDLIIPNFSWPGPNWAAIKRHYAFHYVGVLSLLLAFMAKKRKWPNIFFLSLAIFYILKLIGFPLINNIGYLPIFKSIYYPKYLSPYFALSIAILAGSGLGVLEKVDLKKLSLFFLLWLSAVVFILVYYWPTIKVQGATVAIIIRTAKPLLLLFAVIILLILYKQRLLRISWNFVAISMIVLVVFELFAYLPNDRSDRHNPQKKAPYIKYLKQKEKVSSTPFRVVALDRLLFPNSSALFQIEDIRLLDALIIERYKDFVASFMDRVYGSHITGHENIDFNSSLLNLMNTRYIVSTDPIKSQITTYFIRYTSPKPEYMKEDKNFVAVIKESGDYVFKLAIPPSAKGLVFKASAKKRAELTIDAGQGELSKDLDQKWQKVAIKVRSEENKPLVFNFHLKLRKDDELRIKDILYVNKARNNLDNYKLVYDKKVMIYENKNVLPRAFIVYDYVRMPNAKSVLNALANGNYNLRKTVLLEEKLNKPLKKRAFKYTKINFIQKRFNFLSLKVNNPHDGLLFLSDNYYPGWKAFVNGKEVKIYKADYTFRAIRIPGGKNKVKFVYCPASFVWGLLISLLGIASLISVLIIPAIKRKIFHSKGGN